MTSRGDHCNHRRHRYCHHQHHHHHHRHHYHHYHQGGQMTANTTAACLQNVKNINRCIYFASSRFGCSSFFSPSNMYFFRRPSFQPESNQSPSSRPPPTLPHPLPLLLLLLAPPSPSPTPFPPYPPLLLLLLFLLLVPLLLFHSYTF